jgi:hypothetical protein
MNGRYIDVARRYAACCTAARNFATACCKVAACPVISVAAVSPPPARLRVCLTGRDGHQV